MSKNDKKNRAVAYARTSMVLRQDPTLQLVTIRDYAARNGFELVDEYVDQISGTKGKRPGLDSLLAACKTKGFDTVIVTALDRLGRNTRNMLELAEYFQKHTISLISLRESITLDSPSGRAFFGICSIVAQLDRDQIAERIRVALAAKKLVAEQTGSGWKCGRPLKLTPEVKIQIEKLHAQGFSIRDISRRIGGVVSHTVVQKYLKSCKENLAKNRKDEVNNSK